MSKSVHAPTLRLRQLIRPVALAVVACTIVAAATRAADNRDFTRNFRIEDCKFKSVGANPYFILRPGQRSIFDGEDDGVPEHLRVTVLDQTRDIDVPGVGTVTTRVVEEKEWHNGTLAERSLNYFAICAPTNDVYYFGEDVDIFEDDGSVSHEGAWLAGRKGARPGIVMPGTFLLGSRYYQELAPGVALDRAEHTSSGLSVETGEGTFRKCVKIVETSEIEPGDRSVKIYCPGVGVAVDDEFVLTRIVRPGSN
jgi:hypothetical protein